MNISKREKTLLVAVLVAAAIAGFYLLFYQPLIIRTEQVFALVESEQSEIQNLLLKEQENKTMLEEIAKIENEIDAVVGALPKADDEPGLVIHLHHMFAPYDGINSIQIGDPIVHPEFSEVAVGLSFEGTYDAFNSLLKALENSTYVNRLTSFSVSETQTVIDVQVENVVQPENETQTIVDVQAENVVQPEIEAQVVNDAKARRVSVDMALTFYFAN